MYSFNIIKIDLRLYKTSKQLQERFDALNFPSNMSVKKTIEMKKTADILFFDSNTLNIFAYVPKFESNIVLLDEFSSFLMNSEKEIEVDAVLDIDTILEKINLSGVSSLSKTEKEFLNTLKNK
jgi:hypothetical protein